MAYGPPRRASCPSRLLSLVCKIPVLSLGLSETNTTGYICGDPCRSASPEAFFIVDRKTKHGPGTLVLHDCRPGIIHVSMLRWFGRDGQHFHAALGFEAMPTPLGYDHQHAGRQLQGLQALIDDNIKERGPLQHLHDLIPVRMPLPATPPAKMRRENAPVTIGGEGGKRFERLGIGRVPRALFEHWESGEIAV